MVRFVTLFVGLVLGQHDVQLAVSGPVARVEVHLNGAQLGSVSREPWVVRCDFGRELRPGRLVAIGLDEQGGPVGGDEQWINLPSDRAQAAILPVLDESGRMVGARVTWESPEFGRPRSVRFRLDGEPIGAGPGFAVDLSGVDPDRLHLITAELAFSDGVVVWRELAFGMGFTGEQTSELTALPVAVSDSEQLPPVEQLDGWFLAGEQPLPVVAVDRDVAQLIVVSDPASKGLVEELFRDRRLGGRRRRAGDGEAWLADELDEDVSIRVLVPEPVVPEGRSRAALLFPFSKSALPGSQGILKAVLASRPEYVLGEGLMLGDAVAMAGIRAAEGNHRRAVVLLVGPEREDISRVRPETARRFLDDVHVPLVVWDLSGERGSPPAGWVSDREISDVEDLRRAVRRLRDVLDQQRIVWLSGRHLPQELELGPAARGIALVR